MLALLIPCNLITLGLQLLLLAISIVSLYMARRKTVRLFACVMLCLCAGLLSGSVRFFMFLDQRVQSFVIEQADGCIVSPVLHTGGVARFEFVLRGATWPAMQQRYRVSWFHAPDGVTPGTCWQLTLRTKPPRAALNESGFDYERWLFSRRIMAIASVKNSQFLQLSDAVTASHKLLMIRLNIHSHLQGLLSDYSAMPLLGALAVGLRDQLSQTDWEVLKRTGTAHLMAISGLHISLAGVLGFWLGRYLPIGAGWRFNLIDRGYCCGLLGALAYSALSGFAISTLRAILMLALWFGLRILRLHLDAWTVLWLAIATLLLFDPFQAAGTGLWLTGGAVAAILLSTHTAGPVSGVWAKSRLAVRIQLALMLMLFPVSLAVAGGISWVSLPVNLILIPLFSLIVVPGVLLALLMMNLWPMLSEYLWIGVAAFTSAVWSVLITISKWPQAYTLVSSKSQWIVIPVLLIGIYWLLPRSFPARSLSLLLVLPVLLQRQEVPPEGEFYVDVLDVGQALAVIVQTRSQILVYDTGNAWPGGNTGQQLLVPLLQQRGAKHIDMLVVSHADRDHAGGAQSLQAAFPVGAIRVGESVSGLHDTQPCLKHERWQADGVTFEFLHPEHASEYEGNDQSCVLLISSPIGRALLTGDLGGALERRLLPLLENRPVAVFIGAHHGSLTSSDAYFTGQLHPAYAVFSNGYANQWGMPRTAVIRRWQSAHTDVLTTAQHGQLQFRANREGQLSLFQSARSKAAGVWRWRQQQN